MSEIRYWYRPKSPWIEIMETEQNPCGCCQSLILVTKKHWPYNHSKGNARYCFYADHRENLDYIFENNGWKELK